MTTKIVKLSNAEISLLIEGLNIWDDEYSGVKDYEVNDKKNIDKLKKKLIKFIYIKTGL